MPANDDQPAAKPVSESLPPAARRVAAALRAAGHPEEIRIVADSAHTAEQAAASLGVDVRRIVKSMVFRGTAQDRVVLVLVAGDRRVDRARVAAVVGEEIVRADPDWIRERTGFAVGGVSPVAHLTPALVVVDRDLPPDGELWAGAGTSQALFRTDAAALESLTAGVAADVSAG
ncbi:MAG: YbaK/EbsC family protein [Solirubrobacterales bacterium]